jgi:hypothetical protein
MVLHGHAKHGVKEKMVLAYNMMPQTRRMEKALSAGQQRTVPVLHPDLTKMEKNIVRRASSGIGCCFQ